VFSTHMLQTLQPHMQNRENQKPTSGISFQTRSVSLQSIVSLESEGAHTSTPTACYLKQHTMHPVLALYSSDVCPMIKKISRPRHLQTMLGQQHCQGFRFAQARLHRRHCPPSPPVQIHLPPPRVVCHPAVLHHRGYYPTQKPEHRTPSP
jgi:hypothetical protein